MGTTHTIKRYSSYYRGWCLSFGEHDITYDEKLDVNWAFGDSHIGLVISAKKTKQIFRELLRKHDHRPRINLSGSTALINNTEYVFAPEERDGARRFIEFIRKHTTLHMFLTSHFCYPAHARIVTFSPKKPIVIMYKEITPMDLTIL